MPFFIFSMPRNMENTPLRYKATKRKNHINTALNVTKGYFVTFDFSFS